LKKDCLEWAEILGSIAKMLQKKMKHSFFLTASWQPEFLVSKAMVKEIDDNEFKKIQSRLKTLPVLILNNALYPEAFRKASKSDIEKSPLIIFRLLRSMVEKPFIYAYPYVDKILYINLDHRLDRRRVTEKELDKYFQKDAIERISAVYTPQNGHYGCLQSHIKALKHAVSNYPGENILICEDDVQFLHDPRKVLHMFFNDQSTHDWDVLLLGHTKDYDVHKTVPIASNTFVRVISTQTAVCYLLKGRYIPVLLQLYSDDLNKYHRTNIWTDRYCTDQSWKKLMLKDRWYAFKERRVACNRLSYSDIEKKVYEHYRHELPKTVLELN
jgi:GR25 family glycosyltransferase involved in LPS biosynthesis